jgi:progressive ankylosis protein
MPGVWFRSFVVIGMLVAGSVPARRAAVHRFVLFARQSRLSWSRKPWGGTIFKARCAAIPLAARAIPEPRTHTDLSYGQILRFYLPLALSWLFMALESPISTSVISRRPDPVTNTAGFLVLMGLAMWIESPVIDLLSTSTTLAKNRQSYAALSRFVWMLMAWVTGLHALIVFTPLYDWITLTILRTPTEVAASARVGMMIMVPWSAFIGWRRYLQGILIRYGQTRLIGMGTAIRVVTMGLTALVLFYVSEWPGTVIAAIGLVVAVVAEAGFIHWAARETIAKHLSHADDDPAAEPLTLRKLLAFHLPLSATTVVTLSATPVIAAGLARTHDAVLSMAAYQVLSTLLWLHRTVTFALPEAVITLYRDKESAAVLRRFCLGVGAWASGILLLLSVTGGDMIFFERILHAPPEVSRLAHIGFLAGGLTPLIGAAQAYIRGILTAHHLTVSRLVAVLVSMGCMVAALNLGVALQWSGVLVAAFALTAALLAELGVLYHSFLRNSISEVDAVAAKNRTS